MQQIITDLIRRADAAEASATRAEDWATQHEKDAADTRLAASKSRQEATALRAAAEKLKL